MHTTGICKRRFLPNLQRVKLVKNGRTMTSRVCTSCIKRGKVVKA